MTSCETTQLSVKIYNLDWKNNTYSPRFFRSADSHLIPKKAWHLSFRQDGKNISKDFTAFLDVVNIGKGFHEKSKDANNVTTHIINWEHDYIRIASHHNLGISVRFAVSSKVGL